MKKIQLLIIPIMIITFIVFGACKIDKVNPPATTTTTGTPTTVSVTLSSSTIANSGTATVTAVVTDASSVVMPNVSVSFSVISSTAGSLNPASAVTNASGQATSVFTAGAAVNATATIRASVTVGASTISGSAPISIGTPPQVPTTITVSLGSAAIANGGNTSVSATVLDASSLPISGQTVTFSASVSGAGNFTPAATAMTNASGVASVTFTAVAAGNDSIVDIGATAGTVNNSASLTIGTPAPPAAASMTLTVNPQQLNITNQATVSVTLLSSSGAPAFTSPVTVAITSGATLGSLSSLATVTSVNLTTNASGAASAIFYSGSSSGVVTITATSGALSKTASINITSDPASISLTIVNPSLVNGQNTNITTNVLNAANQPVSDGTTVTFTMLATGSAPGQLSSATAFTVNGIASVTFTASASNTGPVFVTASAGTTAPVTDTKLLTVSAAQAGSIIFDSAVPQIIGIQQSGTQDTSIVTFQVLNSVGVPLADQSVDFTIAIGPPDATLDTGGGISSSGSTDTDGKVSTILHSGAVAGAVRIVATTVAPGPPSVTLSTSSGNISVGGGVPSAKWLSLSASKLNIDGAGCDGVETTINARLADRFGNYNILEGTSVSFAAEGGAIDASNVTDDNGLASVVFRSQEPRPTDGRVSILVMTTGEEYFEDANANGVYDVGVDTFTSIPEPFIDSNEDGVRGAGELFFDWPLSVPTSTIGSYNSANGVWDAQIPIFNNITILLTGSPVDGATLSRIETFPTGTAAVNLGSGGSQVFTIYVSDASGNAPIAGTTVSIKASKGTLSTSSVTIPDTNGSGPYRINVRLTGPSCASLPCAPETGTLSADITWTGTCGGTITVPIFYPGAINIY